MFIQTEQTPNPATLKFLPGCAVMESGTANFTDPRSASRSPLAERLFALPEVTGVFLAADFITKGIRCNAICPATVESPSLRQRIAEQAARSGQSEETVHAAFVARQPLGRLGQPEEIAALVTYLASDESSFTTGAAHLVDAGWSN